MAAEYARSGRTRETAERGKQKTLQGQIGNNGFGEAGDLKKVDRNAAYLLSLEVQVAYNENDRAAFQEATHARAAALAREAVTEGSKSSEDEGETNEADAKDPPSAPLSKSGKSAKKIKDLRAELQGMETENKNWKAGCSAATGKLAVVLDRAEKAEARIADTEARMAALASSAAGSNTMYVERSSSQPATQHSPLDQPVLQD